MNAVQVRNVHQLHLADVMVTPIAPHTPCGIAPNLNIL